MSVWLATPSGQQQARLDGFKSRALRAEAPTQRHLYTTFWRHIEVVGGASAEVLVVGNDESIVPTHAPHENRVVTPHPGGRASVALATAAQCGSLAALPLVALEAALVLVQAQANRAPAPKLWLLTTAARNHGGWLGLSRSARAEASLPLVCIDAPVITLALSVGLELTEPEAVWHQWEPVSYTHLTLPTILLV